MLALRKAAAARTPQAHSPPQPPTPLPSRGQQQRPQSFPPPPPPPPLGYEQHRYIPQPQHHGQQLELPHPQVQSE